MFEKGVIRRLLELTRTAVTGEREGERGERCVMISFMICSVTVFMLRSTRYAGR